jgi:hypothetical protein
LDEGYTCFIYETDLVRNSLEKELVSKYGNKVRFVEEKTLILGQKVKI